MTDQTILDQDYTASMVPGSFEFAYIQSDNAQKLKMTSFKLLIAINENEMLELATHGDNTNELRRSRSSLPLKIS